MQSYKNKNVSIDFEITKQYAIKKLMSIFVIIININKKSNKSLVLNVVLIIIYVSFSNRLVNFICFLLQN